MQSYRSPSRRHQQQVFYKYMSAQTVKIVLAGQTLRWSAPTIFNDPFDVPRELAFGISPHELQQACNNYLLELHKTPPSDYAVLQEKLALVLRTYHERATPQLKQKILDVYETPLSQPKGDATNELREWWKNSLPELRILCLVIRPDITSMWYHYAERYTGVVVELLCSDELDSPWPWPGMLIIPGPLQKFSLLADGHVC